MPKSPTNCFKPGKDPKEIGKKRPTFEEAAPFYIENEADRMRAISFSKWLRENDLPPVSGGGYNWYINFYYTDCNKEKYDDYYRGIYHGCYIKMYYDTWHIFPAKDILERILFYKELKEVLWKSVYPCNGCRYGCYKNPDCVKYRKVIFGREFVGKDICIRTPICFSNPDDKTLDILKDILLERQDEDDLLIDYTMSIDNYGIFLK